MFGERISYGSARARGFALAATSTSDVFNAGDTWQIDFGSDRPVSPQQFFDLVQSFQGQIGAHFDTISFEPIDQTHFRTIIKFKDSGVYHGPGDSQIVDGIRFVVLDAKPYKEASLDTPTATANDGLSTGAMFGIAVAGATALGGVVYLATRKPKRRRRS